MGTRVCSKMPFRIGSPQTGPPRQSARRRNLSFSWHQPNIGFGRSVNIFTTLSILPNERMKIIVNVTCRPFQGTSQSVFSPNMDRIKNTGFLLFSPLMQIIWEILSCLNITGFALATATASPPFMCQSLLCCWINIDVSSYDFVTSLHARKERKGERDFSQNNFFLGKQS